MRSSEPSHRSCAPISLTVTVIALLLPLPGSAWASGSHGSPTPTCRKGCKPLSPGQIRQLRQHPNELPPQIGRGPAR